MKSENQIMHETGIRSFLYALRGIRFVFKNELNARLHMAVTAVVIVLGFIFKIRHYEWIGILLCIGMVLVAEIFNTAIERLVDKISPQFDEKAGLIKDISAGAVFFSAIISVITGIVIFIPYILETFKRMFS